MPATTARMPVLAHDWLDALSTPFAFDVDNDGVEDVVGKFCESGGASVYVRAVSGRTSS